MVETHTHTEKEREGGRDSTPTVTHKLFLYWKSVKQLHSPKIITRSDSLTAAGYVCCVDVGFACILGPNPKHFLAKDAEKEQDVL